MWKILNIIKVTKWGKDFFYQFGSIVDEITRAHPMCVGIKVGALGMRPSNVLDYAPIWNPDLPRTRYLISIHWFRRLNRSTSVFIAPSTSHSSFLSCRPRIKIFPLIVSLGPYLSSLIADARGNSRCAGKSSFENKQSQSKGEMQLTIAVHGFQLYQLNSEWGALTLSAGKFIHKVCRNFFDFISRSNEQNVFIE